MRPPRNDPGINTAYLVSWPTHEVIKAGYTGYRRRYRAYELRGADILGVWEFSNVGDALRAEATLDRCLRVFGDVAFESAGEAAALIGGGGAGYTECIRVPSIMRAGAVEQCAVAMLTSNAVRQCCP